MTGPSRRNYKILALILAVAIALAAAAVIQRESAPHYVGVGTPVLFEASPVSSQGLRLDLAYNTTILDPGQRLNVIVSLFNTLPSVNTVATSGDWLFQGVPVALWPPCYFNAPVQAVVLKGNYTLQDLRTVANVTFSIACMESESIDHAIFQPSSSQANLTGLYGNSNRTEGPFQLSANFTTSGYWDLLNNSREPNQPILGAQQYPPRPPTAIAFVPGVYTVAVADEWGQAVILHVVVRSGGGTNGTQTTTTSSSSTGIATASVSNSSDGLSLNLEVLPGGNGTFTVTAYESNLLSSVNNVTEANQWKYPAYLLNPADNCAPTNDPVGFAIFQGYYGMSNYTSGKALPLYNTNVEFHCTENIYANEYLFQPMGDFISVYNHGQFETNGTASLSLLAGGYWTGGAGTPTSASFSEFRGVYTVLAADEWGNVLLLHFTVD